MTDLQKDQLNNNISDNQAVGQHISKNLHPINEVTRQQQTTEHANQH